MGQRASNTAEIVFNNTEVPVANLIGREGDGSRIAKDVFARARPGVAAA